MLQIDSFAYKSKLLKTAPRIKIIFGAIPLVICLVFESYSVSILTILIMAVMSVYYSKITALQYLKLLSVPMGFLIIGTVTIVFSKITTETAVLSIPMLGGNYGITWESIMRGASLVLKALGAVSCMYFISLNTAMNDILNFLNDIKIPNIIISLMELIYRYIFVILDEANKMRVAQSSRLGYEGFVNSMKSAGELIGTLFIRAYLRCDKIYEALESRGYDGEFKHIKYEYSSSKALCASSAVICTILILAGLLEKGVITI